MFKSDIFFHFLKTPRKLLPKSVIGFSRQKSSKLHLRILKSVKLKEDMYCLAKMSTNFHELFVICDIWSIPIVIMPKNRQNWICRFYCNVFLARIFRYLSGYNRSSLCSLALKTLWMIFSNSH